MRNIVLIVSVTILTANNIIAQWLDKQTLQSTVLLEKITPEGYMTHGTGFLMYNYEDQTEIIVVTCAHLLSNKNQISVRVNPDSAILNHLTLTGDRGTLINNVILTKNSIRIIVDLTAQNTFIHPKLDIAAFYFNFPNIVKHTDTGIIEIKTINLKLIPYISGIQKRESLSLGDEVYFIGFPLGYGVTNYVEPIVRSGSVAWLPKEYDFFLLDALSYGGSSGSPIFQKVIVGSKPGSLNWSEPKLMGMIVGHQSMKLENILNQPDPKELKFEVTDVDLNIGLARCVYTDDIVFTVKELLKQK